MNLEGSLSNPEKPSATSFLAEFTFEQQQILKDAGIESQEILKVALLDPEFKNKFEAEKSETDIQRENTEIKKEEIDLTGEKVQEKKGHIEKQSQINRTLLQTEMLEGQTLTPENAAVYEKQLVALAEDLDEIGIADRQVNFQFKDRGFKSEKREIIFGTKPVTLDLGSGKIFEGVQELSEKDLQTRTIRSLFYESGDNDLGDLDLAEFKNIAQEINPDKNETFTPLVWKILGGLAAEAKYDLASLKTQKILGSDGKINLDQIKNWLTINREELSRGSTIDAASLRWREEPTPKNMNEVV
ncbi:MAG: hypothetical protein WCV72_02810 [Patescibacteria group bacterium]|jgi:hypothetical protein